MKKMILLLPMLFLLLAFGCSRNDTTPVKSVDNPPQSSEMPDAVRNLLDQNTFSYEDTTGIASLAANLNPPTIFDTSYDIYAVTFLWGHLFNLSNVRPPDTTDWSGSLYINGESHIAVTRVIGFERGQDSLLPGNNPAMQAWVSMTNGDFDGIACLLFLKRGVVYIVAPTLHFATPPLNLEFSFDKLERLSAYYVVDSINAVAVQARRIYPRVCPEGIMLGEWIKATNAGDSGFIRGQWLDQNSDPIGVFAGVFWTTADGQRPFYGWVSGQNTTQIIAYMRGIWLYDDPRMCPLCGTGHGRYRGIFKYTNQRGMGIVDGEFGDFSLPPESLTMPLKGVWKTFCPHMNDGSVTPN
jgi:hypothetical protein